MTTQSPDQSLSQSIRDIEQKHTKCRGVHVTTHYKAAFRELADLVTNLAKEVEASLGVIERCHQCEGDGCAVCAELQSIPQLNASLTQSPEEKCTCLTGEIDASCPTHGFHSTADPQSPAPPKEIEEILATIPHARDCEFIPPILRSELQDCSGAYECTCWHSKIIRLAAELGKEREVERANSATAIHVADMDARLLRDENASLKRELAEAESVIMATRQASIEAFNRIRVLVGAPIEGTLSCEAAVAQKLKELHAELAEARELSERNFLDAIRCAQEAESAQTKLAEAEANYNQRLKHENNRVIELLNQNIALSASYQRQKEAHRILQNRYRGQLDNLGEYKDELFNALAETPDVSLWQPIESAPKDMELLVSGFNNNDPTLGRWVTAVTWIEGWCSCERCEQYPHQPTHWMPLPPPPTLQPDHQK